MGTAGHALEGPHRAKSLPIERRFHLCDLDARDSALGRRGERDGQERETGEQARETEVSYWFPSGFPDERSGGFRGYNLAPTAVPVCQRRVRQLAEGTDHSYWATCGTEIQPWTLAALTF